MATRVLVRKVVRLAFWIRANEVPSPLQRLTSLTRFQTDFATDPLFSTRDLGNETVLTHRLMTAAKKVVAIVRIFAAAQENQTSSFRSTRPPVHLTMRADRFVGPNNRDSDFECATAGNATDCHMQAILDPSEQSEPLFFCRCLPMSGNWATKNRQVFAVDVDCLIEEMCSVTEKMGDLFGFMKRPTFR
jgi:hypothetical protein